MFTINNTAFRNLEEQVLKNQSDIEWIKEQDGTLNAFGLKVIEQLEPVTELPDVADYSAGDLIALWNSTDPVICILIDNEGTKSWSTAISDYKAFYTDYEYGDTIAVGDSSPYYLLTLTRASINHENDYWFNIGTFPLAGPTGPTGATGPITLIDTSIQTIESAMLGQIRVFIPTLNRTGNIGDDFLAIIQTTDNNHYYLTTNRITNISGNYITATMNTYVDISGPKGDTGNGISSIIKTGTSGLVDTYTITFTNGTQTTFNVTNGAKGDKGDKGDTGASFQITGTLASSTQLPAPTESIRNQAYLIPLPEEEVNHLYIITGNDTLVWEDTGPFQGVKGDKGDRGERGNGISSITKTATSGLDDTYTMHFYPDSGYSYEFTVKNGRTGETGNGIASITKTNTSGLVDTYTITFTDGNTTTFNVTNGAKGDTGNGISSIIKSNTSGLVDTYTITFTDGNTTTFNVTNGAKGDKGDKGDTGNGISSIEKTNTSGLVDTYTITFINGNTTTFTVTNGEKGAKGDTGDTGNGISSIAKTNTSGLVDTYTITFTDGNTTTFNVTNGADAVTDSALSTSSTNAVQNKIITNALNNKQNTLTAGNNISISNNTISATDTTYESKTAVSGGNAVSLVTTGEKYTWNNKQNTLTAGSNISISNNTISATDTTYSAGTGLSLNNTTFNMTGAIPYTTTAPSAANTDNIKLAVLSSEPATYYSGWLYFIQES